MAGMATVTDAGLEGSPGASAKRSAKQKLLHQGTHMLHTARRRVARGNGSAANGRAAGVSSSPSRSGGALRRRSAAAATGRLPPDEPGRDSLLKHEHTITDWFAESEQLIQLKLQRDVFASRHETVQFVAKLKKPRKGAKDRSQTKPQLLALTKANSASKNDEISAHIIAIPTWSVRKSYSMRQLRIVDGNPEFPFTDAFTGSNLNLKLEFQTRTGKARVFAILGSLREKSLVTACLLELCQRFFNFAPQAPNVNLSELRLVATEEVFSQRCAILASSNSVRQTAAKTELSSDEDEATPSSNQFHQYTADDTDSVGYHSDSDASEAALARQPSSLSERGLELSAAEVANQILSPGEQDELLEILQSEGLDLDNAGTLSGQLQERITGLEEETCAVLRTWEDLGAAAEPLPRNGPRNGTHAEDSSHGGAQVDPIGLLIDQLDRVHTELEDMDAWMSHYNMELRTMRKDILKIEQQNNQLQVQSRNHDNLRRHLSTLLSHYAISRSGMEVQRNLESIIREDLPRQVDDGQPPPIGEPPALQRLVNTARELQLAVSAKAHLLHEQSNEAHLALIADSAEFPEESALAAVHERVEELRSLNASFAEHIRFFCTSRIRASADDFRSAVKTLARDKRNDLPCLARRQKVIKELGPYSPLISALRGLDGPSVSELVRDYVADVGEAHGDILRDFFDQITKRLVQSDAGHSLAIVEAPPSRLDNREQEVSAARNLASTIASDRSLSPALALQHCLEQLIPVLLDEQSFLGDFFWELSAYRAAKTDDELREIQARLGGKSLEQCSREHDNALYKIFIAQGTVLNGLKELIPERDNVSQLVMMAVEVEALAAQYNDSRFLNVLLVNKPHGLRTALQSVLQGFFNKQIEWVESQRLDPDSTPVANAFSRFPRFVDQLVALWDAAAHAPRLLCSNDSFDSTSDGFLTSPVGRGIHLVGERLFAWLQNVCQPLRPEKAVLARLENLHFFATSMESRGGQALRKLFTWAESTLQETLDIVVSNLVNDYFSHLVKFVDNIDELLLSYDADQVKFSFSRLQLAKLMQLLSAEAIATGLTSALRCIAEMSATPQTSTLIISRLQRSLIKTYVRYASHVKNCYGDVVQPSAEQVNKQLEATIDEFGPLKRN